MCREVQCSKCGNSTFAGCGQHVESVKASVAKKGGKWCTCQQQSNSSNNGIFIQYFK